MADKKNENFYKWVEINFPQLVSAHEKPAGSNREKKKKKKKKNSGRAGEKNVTDKKLF